MAVRDLVFHPDPVLLQKCETVTDVDDAIRQLVDDMAETMYHAPGVGLAAPQIGVTKRVAVIDVAGPDNPRELHVFINPEIVHRQGHIVWEEGCLSIPGIYEKVDRSEKVVVRALDREGKPFELEAEDLFAVAIQHELDHLDGVLFLERLSMLKRRLALKKYKKLRTRAEEEEKNPAEPPAQK